MSIRNCRISATDVRVTFKNFFITTARDTSGKFQKQIHILSIRVDRYSTRSFDDHGSNDTCFFF